MLNKTYKITNLEPRGVETNLKKLVDELRELEKDRKNNFLKSDLLDKQIKLLKEKEESGSDFVFNNTTSDIKKYVSLIVKKKHTDGILYYLLKREQTKAKQYEAKFYTLLVLNPVFFSWLDIVNDTYALSIIKNILSYLSAKSKTDIKYYIDLNESEHNKTPVLHIFTDETLF